MRGTIAVMFGFWCTAVAVAQEPAVVEDDSHLSLEPAERQRADNPTDAHVAFMRALDERDLSAETERQNELEDARRVALIDLFWGLR